MGAAILSLENYRDRQKIEYAEIDADEPEEVEQPAGALSRCNVDNIGDRHRAAEMFGGDTSCQQAPYHGVDADDPLKRLARAEAQGLGDAGLRYNAVLLEYEPNRAWMHRGDRCGHGGKVALSLPRNHDRLSL